MKTPKKRQTATRRPAIGTTLLMAILLPHIASSQDDASEEIFELSPFTVDGSSNEGYRATSTLAGSRLKTDLKDVATSVSVATEEFMSDLGATNAEDLLIHMTGAEVSGTSGNFSGAGTEGDFADFDGLNRSPSNETRVRGLAGADSMRNFFRTNIPWEGYNIERIEVNRGANAVLFGVGSPAGLINSTTKSIVWNNENEISLRFGTNGRRRLTIDTNRELIENKLAIRLMAVDNHDEYRQQPAYKDDQRIYGTFTYKPLENTILSGNIEAGSIESNRPRLGAPMQSISQWWDEGQPYVDNTPGLTNDQKFVYPQTGERTSVPGGDAGVYPMSGLWGRASIVYPDPNSDQTGVVWGEQYDGSTGDGDLLGKSYRLSREYFRATTNDIDKDFYKDSSIVDRNIFDYRNNLLEGNMKREEASFDAVNASLQQFFLDRKLGLEFSFSQEHGTDNYVNPLNWRNYNVAVDLTRYLRDGVENPNYGRPFVIDTGWGGHREYYNRDLRATAFYDLDFRERNEWIGRHIVTGVLSKTEQTQRSWGGPPYGSAEDFAGIGGNSRSWGRGVPIIHYVGDSMADAASYSDARIVPITANQYPVGTESVFNKWKPWQAEYADGVEVPLLWSDMDMRNTASGSDFWLTELESQVAVLQSYMLKDKLVSTISYRKDDFTDFAAGTPPTYENGYLNVDSPEWALSDEPGLDLSESTWSYGLVAHAPDFVNEALAGTRLSLLYSESSNFRPTRQRYNIWGDAIGHETGSNQEYGIQLEALEGKLFFRAVQFTTSQDNMTAGGLTAPKNSIGRELASIRSAISKGYNDHQPDLVQMFSIPDGLTSTFIWEETADADGVLTINSDGRNGVVVATMDSVAEGYEFEVDYNVNKNWSLRFNAAKQESTSGNIGTDFKRYIDEVIRPMRDGPLANLVQGNPANWSMPGQVDEEAGEVWVPYPEDSNQDGLPLRPGYWNDERYIPNPAPGQVVQKFDDEGNLISEQGHIMTLGELIDDRILSTYESVLATEGKPSSELRKWRWNMQTRYRFTEGRFKGTTVGGSLRWQDKVAIGYPVTTNDTNGARVIDVNNPYMGDEEFDGDLFVSHRRKLGENLDWTVQLNIKNAFNGADYVPVAVQPDGSLAAVRATEGAYWQITNTFEF